jgi:putative SOS response-associated peptidase YedK
MCGRVIQSSAPIRYAIVDGLDVRDTRVHNYPPRWNGAPSQDLLVIRPNHQTGKVALDPLRWGLIPYWCEDPKGGRKPGHPVSRTSRTVRTGPDGAKGLNNVRGWLRRTTTIRAHSSRRNSR